MSKALDDVLAERQRQIGAGYDAAHDDEHVDGEIARAAAAYALHDSASDAPPRCWPFGSHEFRAGARRANLVKAAAMLLAEVERLDRASDSP